MTNQRLIENKVRRIVREVLSEGGSVSTSTLTRYVDDCMDKIAKVSGLGEEYDAIKLAETIIDYLTKKHVRYKSAMIKHGGYKE